MGRGGARTRVGPPADPMALKREYDRREWTRLPKSGCTLDVPEWPVEFPAPDVAELSLWNRLWKSPQAIVWHNDGLYDIVAIYTRVMIQCADPRVQVGLITQFRQLSEQLLLTTPSLRQARFFIEGGPEEAFMGEQDPDGPPLPKTPAAATGTDDASSIMRRFRVIRPTEDDDDNGDPAASDE